MSAEKKILVIDDDQNIRETLSECFDGEGYTTKTAENGKVGLALAQEFMPDLILLDIVMPEMDGWETLNALKQSEWGKNIPVMMLTNLDDVESVSRAVEHDTYEYLVKSNWSLEDIVSKVKTKLE